MQCMISVEKHQKPCQKLSQNLARFQLKIKTCFAQTKTLKIPKYVKIAKNLNLEWTPFLGGALCKLDSKVWLKCTRFTKKNFYRLRTKCCKKWIGFQVFFVVRKALDSRYKSFSLESIFKTSCGLRKRNKIMFCSLIRRAVWNITGSQDNSN